MTTPTLVPSLRRRMAAWLYEGMLLFGVLFAVAYVFSVLTNTRHALEHRLGQQLALFLGLALYFVWQWRRNGQTLAMKTWHIKLVSATGDEPITRKQALLRYALTYLWFIPALVVANAYGLGTTPTMWVMLAWVVIWALSSRLNKNRQFWHDQWSGTRLISTSQRGETPFQK